MDDLNNLNNAAALPCRAAISAADPLGAFDAGAAWLSLSPVQRDLIGALAIQSVFAGFVGQDFVDEADKLLTPEVRAAAVDHEAVVEMAIAWEVEKAFPGVFGAGGAKPEWMVADPRSSDQLEDAANEGGCLKQDDGSWCRNADPREIGAEPFGNGRHILHVKTAREACDRDGLRTATEIADCVVAGLRRVLVPAFMLSEA